MTRIAFIMPTFNRAHFIAESIRSITSQMGADDTLVVIDDGSTDDTATLVPQLGEKLSYHRQENAGKSVALNRAMAMTDSEFVWICDDDDLLCPDAVSTLLHRIGETGADFVFGRYTRFREEDGQKRDLGTGYWPDLSSGSLPRHILEDAFVMQNAALVRREAYERVGPFDETMLRSLDYDMFVRLATQVSCAYADAMIFQQRKHEGARGPASVLHSASQSENVWKDYDRRIFERAYDSLPLSYYEAMFESGTEGIVKRAALLQRGCIMARHDLWQHTVEDLDAAAQIAEPMQLSPLEKDICRRIVAGKHGFGGACDPVANQRLRQLLRSNAIGRAIVTEMLDGLVWRFHQPEAQPKKDAIALTRSVAGVGHFPKLALRRVFRTGRNAPAGAPELAERAEIPTV